MATTLFGGRAEAASSIQFGRIQYDSPGSDTGSNASLNAEWVVLKNVGSRAVSLRGWTVRDAQRHVYTFGTFTLNSGASVTLHTGTGTNSSTHRYWGSRAYIWNNSGDTATLKTASGTTADTCAWTSTGSGYKNC
ncbi:lamin tail domain-containing protein [Actinopolymorpha alba]|uniref:lamin tail domain-containing protein n=1 Tax=Actinopolymorpha alba TaxID=533267 RepID=UPI00192CC7CF|nr:lamin tail domain-containing protein [Actinopolymorpha alba]